MVVVLHKLHAGLDLRQHASGGELAFGDILFALGDRHGGELLLVGLIVVDAHGVHSGEDDETVGTHVLREQRAGAVLVDDGRDAAQTLFGLNDGDAAAADGDDDITGAHELIDNVQLHDALGDRGGDDTAVAASGVLDEDEALFLGDLLGLFLRIEAADGLRRVLEAGVLLVNDDLRHDRGAFLLDAAALQLLLNGLLQMVADIALRHGAALGERHERRSAALVGGELHRQIDHADLRAVAVADDDFVALLYEVNDRAGGIADKFELLLGGLAKSISPESDNNSFSHSSIPYFSVAYITALMVCIRFSASWNWRAWWPRNTSSVTSIASRPNFW